MNLILIYCAILFAPMHSITQSTSDSVLITEIRFVDGVYYHKDRIFNGDIVDYYENKTLRFCYTVLDGRLHGAARVFYASGKLKSERTYFVSKLFGRFIEYFESGEIRLSFDVKLNAYGKGEIVENLNVGDLKKGKYKAKSYDQGIIYFLSENGDLLPNSENISLLNQAKYRIVDADCKKVLMEIL